MRFTKFRPEIRGLSVKGADRKNEGLRLYLSENFEQKGLLG
jgi:hypothetical protein